MRPRFTTVEEAVLAVVKRSGVTEPFSRTKIIAGVRKACQGRPVDEDAIALLAQRVEETIRARGAAEVPSHEVGPGDPRPAAGAGRGGLPALRQRLPRRSTRWRTSSGRSRRCGGDGGPTAHAAERSGRRRRQPSRR